MKSFFSLVGLASLLIFVAGISDKEREIMRKYHNLCLEDSKVDIALVQKVHDGDFSSDDKNLERYVFCISLKNNLITPEGQLRKDVIMSKILIDQDWNEAAVTACMQQQGRNPLEYLWKVAKCYHRNPMPNHP